MLRQEDDVDVEVTEARGSVSAIARHVGRDRKTIWSCLSGNGP